MAATAPWSDFNIIPMGERKQADGPIRVMKITKVPRRSLRGLFAATTVAPEAGLFRRLGIYFVAGAEGSRRTGRGEGDVDRRYDPNAGCSRTDIRGGLGGKGANGAFGGAGLDGKEWIICPVIQLSGHVGDN